MSDTTKGLLFGHSDGTNSIKTKIINIGDWNMDLTSSVSIAHGLTYSKIRSVNCWIRNDADDTVADLVVNGQSTPAVTGGITFSATTINLQRVAGLQYDNTAFDSTSYNRGWITIIYVE